MNGYATQSDPAMAAWAARPGIPRIGVIAILGAMLLFCAGLFGSTRAQAAELCHRPTPRTLIDWYNQTHAQAPLNYDAKGSAIYHPISILRTEQPVIYWIGLAWLFPQSGALFAVNCAGQVLDGISTGAIGHLVLGPDLPQAGQSVAIVYVNKETSECVHDAMKIAALKDAKIISLWDHGYNQGINVAASHARPRQFITENYTVSFADRGLTLHISGVRKVYPFENGRQSAVASSTETIPSETYQWDAHTERFAPQDNYPPRPVCR